MHSRLSFKAAPPLGAEPGHSTVRRLPAANEGSRSSRFRYLVSLQVMAVNAYILIQAEVGSAADVARATGDLVEIVTAEVAMGPYDVIARAEASDMDQLGGVVVNAVGTIPGVERTLLCPIVRL